MKFETPEGGPYLMAHSVGLLPEGARDVLASGVLDPWAHKGEAWAEWLTAIDRFRDAIASLTGGKRADICPQANVSSGLFALLTGMPLEKGRNVILASALSFPSIGFAAGNLERLGLSLRLLPEDRSPADPQVWADAMTGDVAAVIVMHVHSNSGVVAPVADICAQAKARGVFAIVDVAQSSGVLAVDPAGWGAGAVIGSCLKWLCGGPGAGWLWADPAATRDFRPLHVGWFSHDNPFAFDIRDFRYAPDARKFWGATPTVAPFALATAGIEGVVKAGVDKVRAHNRHLIARVADAAPRWTDQLDRTGKGGTICLQAGTETDAIQARLIAADCRFDRRSDTLRLSFHLWNSEADADIVANCLR